MRFIRPLRSQNSVEYWTRGDAEQNFGDALSNLILLGMDSGKVIHPLPLRVVGSVMHPFFVDVRASKETPQFFFGAGVRDAGAAEFSELVAEGKANVTAVRGPISRELLGLSDAQLGDTALLMPALYRPNYSRNRASLLVPHFHTTLSSDLLVQTGADKGVQPRVGPGMASIRNFVKEILASEFVLTGALHVAILRFSYARPFAFWGGADVDLPIKFFDFGGSVGLDVSFVKTLEEGRDWYSKMTSNLGSKKSYVNPLRLCTSAPFHVKPRVVRYLSRNLLPFEKAGFISNERRFVVGSG